MRISSFPLYTEVKEEYLTLRRNGKSRVNATSELLSTYNNELLLGKDDDGVLVWIGLADAQYANKELLFEIAQNASQALHILEQSEWKINKGEITRRRENYCHAPMSERKMYNQRKKFCCSWKVGDTFAYQLPETYAGESSRYKQYVLLRKVSEAKCSDGYIFPVVSLSLWKDAPLPKSTNDYLTVPFLRLDSGRMGFPMNLYEYRTELIVKNQKLLDKTPFIFLGNFSDVSMPEDEVVIDHPAKMLMTILENIDEDLSIYIKKSRFLMCETATINKNM